jgi:hypothetical protein
VATNLQARTIFSMMPRIAKLLTQLFWIWATLDWQVRKARRAFERELTSQGISKQDAQRISKQIEVAKDQIMSTLWQFASK